MSLSINSSIPNPAYLYLPENTTKLAIERFGGEADGLELFDAAGNSLGKPAVHEESGKRNVIQLDAPQKGSVIKVVFGNKSPMALLVDGAPGLLCPSAEIAAKLKGGTQQVGDRILAGPLQARAFKWMLAATAKGLEVERRKLQFDPKEISNPMAEAQLAGALANLPKRLEDQCLDPASPDFGSSGFWDISSMAICAAVKSPVNPYYGDQTLARRTALCALAKITRLQGDELPREGFMGITAKASYPIIHAFFIYGNLTENYETSKDVLEPEAKEIWRDATIALGDKLADYQGYESNQWTHNMRGHLAIFIATGEPRFLGYFEREITSYLDLTWGLGSKFGQHPAGIYLEEYGADGNYDFMNTTSVVAMYYNYKALKEAKPGLVAKLKSSIEKNLHFKSLLWCSMPDGRIITPSAPCSRTPKSNYFGSNPAGDFMAHREFDLGLTHARLCPPPENGVGGAGTFSYYATTDECGRRLLKNVKEGKGPKYDQPPLMREVYMLPLTAKKAPAPFETESGAWSLPGIFAIKSDGIYALDFHDVTGTPKEMRLLSLLGGGPTIVWTAKTGPVFISMPPKTEHNAVNTENDLNFSCVYSLNGKTPVFSGRERSSGKWLVEGKSFEVKSQLPEGELTWRWSFEQGGLLLSVGAPGTTPKFANLPIPVLEEVQIEEGKGSMTFIRDGKAVLRMMLPQGASLSAPVECQHLRAIRCLRFPLPSDGSLASVKVECTP